MKIDIKGFIGSLGKKGKSRYIIIALAAGVILLLLSGTGNTAKEKSAAASEEKITAADFSLEDQEEKIEKILSEVDGAGKVRVMLTLKTGTEQIIAQDTETVEESDISDDGSGSRTETKMTTVILSEDDGESAVPLKYIYPEYMGAVVLAEGAGADSVKLKLTEAVSSLTGLGADKITVIKMKGS